MNFQKVKNWLLGVLGVLLVISVIANLIQYHSTKRANEERVMSQEIIKTTISDLKYKTDSDGNQHVVFNPNQNVITRELAKYEKTLDTVAAKIGEKKSTITDFTQVQISTVATNVKSKSGFDTSKNRPVESYSDKVFTAKFYPKYGTDTVGRFDLGANIDLNYVNYRKRSWIFGSLKSYTDVYSDDDRVSFRGVKRLVIEQREPAFGLRIRGSSTYNPTLKSFSFGPEAAIDFGRNQFRVNGYYNATTNQFRPTFTYTRDFLRL